MNNDARARLAAAAAMGEIVRVVYNRGGQPGTVREIAPVAVSDDEVRARDIATGIDKSFKLASLELVGLQTIAPAYDPAGPADDTRTIQTAVEPHLMALRALGWHVELTEHRVSLHRFFKNGKPRKGYDVTMGFDEFTVDMFDEGDGQGLQTVTRPLKRPYNVSSTSLPTQTFLRLSSALLRFLEEARKLAPVSKDALHR